MTSTAAQITEMIHRNYLHGVRVGCGLGACCGVMGCAFLLAAWMVWR